MNKNKTSEIHDKLTASIIEQLEKGTAPWIRPWSVLGTPDRPMNYATRAACGARTSSRSG